jgi:sugar/nucleoside kinase (ribokinase family)
VIRSRQISTFTYTKLLNVETGVEDLPRLDFLNAQAIPEGLDRELVARFERAAPDFDVILVSDQAETSAGGVVTARLRDALQQTAGAHPKTIIWVDSRMRAEHFRRTIVKPNQQEAEGASMRALGRVDFAAFRRHLEAPLLVITQGGLGALVVDESGETWARAELVEKPVDICGAGDSFSAGAAVALRITGDPLAAARFGNQVASVTIMKKGTGTASPEELIGGPLLR